MDSTKPLRHVAAFLCAGNSVKPKLQSLLLADHVYQDGATGKRIVAGIFNRLAFSKELLLKEVEAEDGKKRVLIAGGMQSGSPYAYVSLTDVHGTVPFQLRYVDLRDDTVLMRLDFKINCIDRLATVELTFPLPKLPTPHEGTFSLELLARDEPLGSLRILVEEMKPTESKDAGPEEES